MRDSKAARETYQGANARNATPDSAPDQPHTPLEKVSHLDEWATPRHDLEGTVHPGLLLSSPRGSRNSTTPVPLSRVPIRPEQRFSCPRPEGEKITGILLFL